MPIHLIDEQSYLASNPDVGRAVEVGEFSSGQDHYLRFGRNENRLGVVQIVDETDPSYPPAHLRHRVHGSESIFDYLSLGHIVAADIDNLVKSGVINVPKTARVLDFGCGPGRVAAWIRQNHPGWKIFGTDIDAEAIVWARSHIPDIATFQWNQPVPPLDYSDSTFDFVYSISIFTHLPEDMQHAWLRELARVTRRGGWLVLTTHSETLLSPGAKMPDSGFYYAVGPGTEGLPSFYQTSFQTSAYIQRTWQQYFRVKKIISRGLAAHQDLVICRK